MMAQSLILSLILIASCGPLAAEPYDRADLPAHTPTPVMTTYFVNVIYGMMVSSPTGMQVCDADTCYLEFISETVPCNTRIGASITVNNKLVYVSDVPFTMGTLTNNRQPGQVFLCKHYVQNVRVFYLTLERGAAYSVVKFTDEVPSCWMPKPGDPVDEPLLHC
jgi:hypothetical protein